MVPGTGIMTNSEGSSLSITSKQENEHIRKKNSDDGDPSVITVLDGLERTWAMESANPDLSHEDPLDGLILTILSQNTNDRNRDRAFESLKRDFPTWEQVLRSEPWELQDSIRVGGLSRVKAARIHRILNILKEKFGEPTIQPLRSLQRKEIEDFLRTLPGIGAKTIACVLLFEFSIPVFPVDTHVSRVCQRIGFVPEGTGEPSIQVVMEKLIHPSRYLGAHLNMISHGRNICKARKPLCGQCTVRHCCRYFKFNSGKYL